ncbi:MAG: NAD-binding protein [Lentimicrobium sp.]|jgi:D-arabinose 1-dehydrogenase-like Zn-dependent alcohol dehydrogenase|nr:NAD-binding protein [Lentimicrobium sp.]
MENNKKFLDTIDLIILGLILLSTIGGTYGWIQYYAQTGDTIPAISAFYKSLQLFVFNVDLSRPSLPWLLEITRFFSPMLLATAIIRQLISATSKHMDVLKITLCYRDHYIVCGLGAVGYKIAEDCRKMGAKVVVIEKYIENPRIGDLLKENAIVLHGDATDKNILKKAGLNKAAALFAVTENDSVNLQIYLQCEECVNKTTNHNRKRTADTDPLRILVHVAESSTINLVYEGEACKQTNLKEEVGPRRIFMKPFNINQIASSQALLDYPPDEYYPVHNIDEEPIHILLIGLGNIGENLLINFARTAHYFCNIPEKTDQESISRKNTVHIVDSNAKERLNEIRALYPGLDKVVNCVVHSSPTLSLHLKDLSDLVARHSIRMAYLCLENDIERFTITHILQQYQLRSKLQVVNLIPTRVSTGMNTLTETVFEKAKQLQENFVQYNIIEKTCKKDILINESLDKIALHIHGIFENNNQSIDLAKATRDWALMPENFYKQSSRFSAEHLQVKLRALSSSNQKITGEQIKEILAGNAELFENLEHIEHIRFVAERLLAGWERTSPEQELLSESEIKALKALKINKTLRPFRTLTDNERAFNQGFLRIMHELV